MEKLRESKKRLYDELPNRGKQTIDGEKMKDCIVCGGKTYMFYHEKKYMKADAWSVEIL